MSLRARLVVGLLVLATVGLVLLAGITYAEQRTFLLNRIDDQLQRASQFGGDRPYDGLRPFGDDHGPPRDQQGLASGTWTFQRNAQGQTIARDCPGCLSGPRTSPRLPTSLPVGRLMTVTAVNTGTRYRVLARSTNDGGTAIVAAPLTETTQTLHRLRRIEALVIVAILVALAALSWFLAGIGLRPLDRMGVTAGAIAGGELSHRIESASPRTEVGRLGLALNRMLDRLERAFAEREASEERLRRFLADASHELRTPLASIRGYAELFRIGAARSPADTEKAMRRIESEAARMGVLVEDLLTLARLDEVREVLREPVDVGRLAADAVDDARATAPDREIDVRMQRPLIVLADPHGVRQVLANLLRNALVHTPAGTPIEVAVRPDGDAVVVEVRDHGPGLPPGSEGRELFERFWRAEQGRERGRAGAGLGLAIVAGIVAAHGGEVDAANVDEGGARFTVRLPERAAAPAAEPARQPLA